MLPIFEQWSHSRPSPFFIMDQNSCAEQLISTKPVKASRLRFIVLRKRPCPSQSLTLLPTTRLFFCPSTTQFRTKQTESFPTFRLRTKA